MSKLYELHPHSFLTVAGWKYAELFDELEYVWEIFPKRLSEFLKQHLKSEIHGQVSPRAFIEGGPIMIGKGSVVEAGAYLRGPLIIGENSEIRHGAYLRGNCLIGDHCVVGHTTEVKNSVFMDGAKAGHFAYIGDSILGRDVNLGAGTKLANLKLSQSNIRLKVNNEIVDTKLRKLGAIMGSGVQTGCNSVCSPGSLLAAGSMVYPCCHVKPGFYKNNSIIQ